MVMADGVRMGTVSRNGKRLGFQYDSRWLESERRYPLSLSMPLVLKEHPHSVIEPFLLGLLPDNPRILEEWGRRFQVSPRNAFSIISHAFITRAIGLCGERPDGQGGKLNDLWHAVVNLAVNLEVRSHGVLGARLAATVPLD